MLWILCIEGRGSEEGRRGSAKERRDGGGEDGIVKEGRGGGGEDGRRGGGGKFYFMDFM